MYHNGNYLGATPIDGYIVYYGKQQFRLIKEGYETLDVVQKYDAPWYEFPGVDFLTENINPFKVRDVRCFQYTMQPVQTVRPDDVRQHAEELRARGQTIGTPAPPRPILVVPVPPPPPPPSLPMPRVLPGQGAVLGGPTPAPPPSVPPSAPPVTAPVAPPGATPGGVSGP